MKLRIVGATIFEMMDLKKMPVLFLIFDPWKSSEVKLFLPFERPWHFLLLISNFERYGHLLSWNVMLFESP